MDSRKRVSGRQLVKGDEEDENESVEEVTNDFARAGEAVLAGRRILKGRRRAGNAIEGASGPQTGAVNPFANIQLVSTVPPPAIPQPIVPQGFHDVNPQEKGLTVESPEEAKVVEDPESEAAEEVTSVPRKDTDEVKEDPKENSHGAPGLEKSKPLEPSDKSTKNPEVVGETAPQAQEGFAGLSASKNAFGVFGQTGFTGFGTSSFSFGATGAGLPTFGSLGTGFSFASAAGSVFGSTASSTGSFPTLVSVFGSNGAPESGALAADGVQSESASIQAPPSAVVTLSEVTVETGEETETSVFTAGATLFEYDGGKWKGRGSGEVRVNIPADPKSGRNSRIIMRGKGNLRLLLNANIFPGLKLSPMDGRGVSFAVVNACSENKSLVTYAMRFKDGDIAESFSAVVNNQIGSSRGGESLPQETVKEGGGSAPAVDTNAGESGENADVEAGAASKEK